MKTNGNDLKIIEAKLIGQEHRLFRILWNFFNRKRKWPNENDPRRIAASEAILWRIFASPGSIAFMTGSALSAFTVFFLYKQDGYLDRQTKLFERQTILIEKQNDLNQQQIHLADGARRSAQTFIMGEVLSDLNRELENQENSQHTISDALVGRIISLSRSMKPYKYLINDSLITKPLSPERGQLLISLLESNIDTIFLQNRIFSKANFQYSDLQGVMFYGKSLAGLNLRYSNLSDARIYSSNLQEVYLGNATLSETFIQDSSLKDATLTNCICDSLTVVVSNLNGVSFAGADLRKSRFSIPEMFNSDLRGTKLQESRWGGLRDINLHGSFVDRKDWLVYIKDSLKFEFSDRIHNNHIVKDSIVNAPNNKHELVLIAKKDAYFGMRLRKKIVEGDTIYEAY